MPDPVELSTRGAAIATALSGLTTPARAALMAILSSELSWDNVSAGGMRDRLASLSGDNRLGVGAIDGAGHAPILKSAADHASDNTELAVGQLGIAIDTGEIRAGIVGTAAWNSLSNIGGDVTAEALDGVVAALIDDETKDTGTLIKAITDAIALRAPITNPEFDGAAKFLSLLSAPLLKTDETGLLLPVPVVVYGAARCWHVVTGNLDGFVVSHGAVIFRHQRELTPVTPASGGECLWLWPTNPAVDDATSNITSNMSIENDAASEAALSIVFDEPSDPDVREAYFGATPMTIGFVVRNDGATGSFTVDLGSGEMPASWHGDLTTVTLGAGETLVASGFALGGKILMTEQHVVGPNLLPISVVAASGSWASGYNSADLSVQAGDDVFCVGIINGTAGTAMSRHMSFGAVAGFELNSAPLNSAGEYVATAADRRIALGHLRAGSTGTIVTPSITNAGVSASIALRNVLGIHAVIASCDTSSSLLWGSAGPLPPGAAALTFTTVGRTPADAPAGSSIECLRETGDSNVVAFTADVASWPPAAIGLGSSMEWAQVTIILTPKPAE